MKLSHTNMHRGDPFQISESDNANYLLCIHIFICKFISITRLFYPLYINKMSEEGLFLYQLCKEGLNELIYLP